MGVECDPTEVNCCPRKLECAKTRMLLVATNPVWNYVAQSAQMNIDYTHVLYIVHSIL